MLLPCFSPLLTTAAAPLLIAASLVIGIVLAARRRHEPPRETPHDVERESRLLTMKIRQPWRYRRATLARWIAGE